VHAHEAGSFTGCYSSFSGKVPAPGRMSRPPATARLFGGDVVRSPYLMQRQDKPDIARWAHMCFSGLDNPSRSTRYHSLVVERASVPAVLEVSATTSDGTGYGTASPRLHLRRSAVSSGSIRTAPGKRSSGISLSLLDDQ
jgi:anthranilate/para-aminobenzoate synthase component II